MISSSATALSISNFEAIDTKIRNNTFNRFGLIDDNLNSRNLRKVELCSVIDFAIDQRTSTVRTSFNCGPGKSVTSLTLHIGEITDVLFASKTISKGSEITPSNAYLRYIPVRSNFRKPNYNRRFEARRTIAENTPFTTSNTSILPDVKEGESIETTQKGNGFTIKRIVTALEDGDIGETIKVDDGRIRNGVVTEKNGQILIKII